MRNKNCQSELRPIWPHLFGALKRLPQLQTWSGGTFCQNFIQSPFKVLFFPIRIWFSARNPDPPVKYRISSDFFVTTVSMIVYNLVTQTHTNLMTMENLLWPLCNMSTTFHLDQLSKDASDRRAFHAAAGSHQQCCQQKHVYSQTQVFWVSDTDSHSTG